MSSRVGSTEAAGGRERVAELEAEVESLRAEVADLECDLAAAERERDAALKWAAFLEEELRASRERIAELEDSGLLARLRRLLA